MDAYLLSHNGIGDNITMIGALVFLTKYYRKVYFLCKDIYRTNVELILNGTDIKLIEFDSKREYEHCRQIINSCSVDDDVFICGPYHSYLKSRIRTLKYEQNLNIKTEFDHINYFYTSIGLDINVYFDYFNINSTHESNEYYEHVKDYSVHFVHTKSSTRTIDIPCDLDSDTLFICANKNMYPLNHPNYELANKYVNIPVAYYIDVIKNAYKIDVIDSCFSCIVYPLMKKGVLDSKRVHIHTR
jgi:hypothetical protein